MQPLGGALLHDQYPLTMSLSKHIVSEHAITTKINFLSSDFPRSQKPFYYTVHNLPQGIAPQNILRSGHQVKIHDVRGAEGFLSIDVNGFEIVQHTTSVQFESFADESIIRDVYLPECEQCVLFFLNNPRIMAI